MDESTCSIDGCEKPMKSLGWCGMHYMRWRRANPDLAERSYTFDERLERGIQRQPDGKCWIWAGGLTTEGYGQIKLDRRVLLVHRVMYERLVGPIPEGLHIDHLCRVRNCVNPDHMEPVTCRENTLRGVGPSAVNATKTHCIRGHEFSEANTHVRPNGDRMCRACARMHNKASLQRRGRRR